MNALQVMYDPMRPCTPPMCSPQHVTYLSPRYERHYLSPPPPREFIHDEHRYDIHCHKRQRKYVENFPCFIWGKTSGNLIFYDTKSPDSFVPNAIKSNQCCLRPSKAHYYTIRQHLWGASIQLLVPKSPWDSRLLWEQPFCCTKNWDLHSLHNL